MPAPRKLTKQEAANAQIMLEEAAVKSIEPFIEAGKATRLQKGQSGRSKVDKTPLALDKPDNTLTGALASELGVEGARKLAKSLIGLATGPKPNLNAIIYIYDRLEGKPRQAEPEREHREEPLVVVLQGILGDNGNKQIRESIDTTYTIQEEGIQEGFS